MIIQCEKCKRKFKIDDTRIKQSGSKVRCSKCGHVFLVEGKLPEEKSQQKIDTTIKEIPSSEPKQNQEQVPGTTSINTGTTEEASDVIGNSQDPKETEEKPIDTQAQTEAILRPENKDTETSSIISSNMEGPATEDPDGTPQEDEQPISEPQANSDSSLTENIEAQEENHSNQFEETKDDVVTEEALSGFSPRDNTEVGTDNLPPDEGNWEQFVNISKTEDIEDISAQEPPTDVHSSEDGSLDFSWDNISLDQNPVEPPAEHLPAMFEDEAEDGLGKLNDSSEINSTDLEKDEISPEPIPHAVEPEPNYRLRSEPDILTLDADAHRPLENQRVPAADTFEQERIHHTQSINPYTAKKTSGFFTKLLYTLITLIVLLIIAVASFAILANIGVIPEHTSGKVAALVESLTPIKFTNTSKTDVIITEHKGGWVDTVNGPIYVISGLILNKSKTPVHHVQIKSEFVSAGETLYEIAVYAGNTFSKKELKNSQLEDILLKLKKRNGDTDFFDDKKLAGLNFNIKPNEAIPFFTVFPSNSKILGLKYNLQIIDYDKELTE